MSHPGGCPEWYYNHIPDHVSKLAAKHAVVLTSIVSGTYTVEKEGRDLRPVHTELFQELTPPGHEYFAGSYRGCHKKCLRNYQVTIPADRRVGCPPERVAAEVHRFSTALSSAVDALDSALKTASSLLSPTSRAIGVVRISCEAFVNYLTIHPYADGNGHTSRALLWILLQRYGYTPKGWTIDPRPTFPAYADMISMHRDGDKAPLEQFVLSCIS